MELTKDYIFFILKVVPSLLIVAFALNYYRNTRIRDMRGLAASLGLPFSLKGPEIGVLRSTGLPLFNDRSPEYTENFFTYPLPNGVPAKIFDYRFTHGGRATCNISVALIDLKRHIPQFTLRPEYLPDKLAALVGFNDIDFAGFPEFSKKYLLKGANADEVRALFTPDIIMFFSRRPDWTIEAGGRHIAFSRGFGYLKPENFQPLIDDLKEIVPMLLKILPA